MSIATSVLFGLVPALHASRVDLIDAVKQGGAPRRDRAGAVVRARGVLVVSEIALAVVLLTGAGPAGEESSSRCTTPTWDFSRRTCWSCKATGVRTPRRTTRSSERSCRESRRCPAWSPSARRRYPPGDLSYAGDGVVFHRSRCRSSATGDVDPRALITIVAPGAFAALGIPLKSGRDFNEGDTERQPLVAIVNEALVRKSFGGSESDRPDDLLLFDRQEGAMTIVGVVGDVRQRNPALAADAGVLHAVHAAQLQQRHAHARRANRRRSHGARRNACGALAAEIVAGSAGVVHDDGSDACRRASTNPRFRARAVWGVCRTGGVSGDGRRLRRDGVCRATALERDRPAHGAGRQPRIRAAADSRAGAGPRGVPGWRVGLAGAVAATRLLTTMLFEVQPVDVQVYLGVVVLLGVVTLVAGYLPARRAAAVDPARVLKSGLTRRRPRPSKHAGFRHRSRSAERRSGERLTYLTRTIVVSSGRWILSVVSGASLGCCSMVSFAQRKSGLITDGGCTVGRRSCSMPVNTEH